MKPSEKKEVIDVFILHRKNPKTKYKALVQLLLKLKNATPSQKRYFNASFYSPANLASLEYDIKKMCNITDRELSGPVNAEKKAKELKVIFEQLPEDKEALQVEIFETAPENVKQGIKLRDEFPFLASEDCPDEFKILTADKLTAYHNFVNGRKELKALVSAGASNEEIFDIAKKTVENFELNLEIYDELNYFKAHGQILGEHPIFAEKMLLEKVQNMSTVELTKRQKNLRTYVSRDEKSFHKMENGDAKNKFAEKLQAWKDELDLVNERLEKIS